MSKSILITDTPTKCRGCQFCSYILNDFTNEIVFICYAMNKLLKCDIDKEKDINCPLKPLPERKEEFPIKEIIIEHRLPSNAYASAILVEKAIIKAKQRGYNDCLDEILGEENE